MNMESMTVSVIIPVYNASATLGDCLDSLNRQTIQRFELLFIDDSSTDRSLDILMSYAEQYSTGDFVVKVLRHERNRGVAAARNTGLEYATGEYVYYVDADDFIEPDTLECLLKEAQEKELDIVGHEWFLTFKSDERYMKQPLFVTPDEALRQMMCGVMRWNLWLFLVRRSLYVENNIRFIEGMNMGEDMMVMMKLFACAKRVTIINRAFYHYGQSNSGSLTKTYSAEHIRQVTNNVQEAERFISASSYAGLLSEFIPLLKLNIKLPLLITDDESRYRQWTEWFPEANGYVMKNKRLPLRTRLLQLAAVKRYDFLLKLYYRFVFKLVYGVIYK
jgi:glycosyltransferase involved in cell wall biosynthesis